MNAIELVQGSAIGKEKGYSSGLDALVVILGRIRILLIQEVPVSSECCARVCKRRYIQSLPYLEK